MSVSAISGRNRWFQRSRSHAEPVTSVIDRAPDAGNHCSTPAKIVTSTVASTNGGMQNITTENPVAPRSTGPARRHPPSMPIEMPITAASTVAMPTRKKVGGANRQISDQAGRPSTELLTQVERDHLLQEHDVLVGEDRFVQRVGLRELGHLVGFGGAREPTQHVERIVGEQAEEHEVEGQHQEQREERDVPPS